MSAANKTVRIKSNPGLNFDSLSGTFTRFKNKYGYLLFAGLVPLFLMLCLYVALQIARAGDGTVLVLDLNAQYVSFYEALRNFIRNGDTSLIYSFQRALGGEFMGIYAYYIASPLSWLVALFPDGCIQEALLFIFLLKTGLCGVTFGTYLQKTQKVGNRVSVIAFSTMYALSSYAITYQHNSMWIDALIWLPIISYGIEKVIRTGDFRTFVVSFTITLMSNYYIGYMCCYYVVIYFLAYYFATSAEKQNNPGMEKCHFLRSAGRMFVWSVVSVGIASVILLGAYYSLQFGKNEFSDPAWKFSLKDDFLDLFAMFLPGMYDTVRTEGMPLVFCGTAPLLLVPAFFISRKFRIREKIAYGCVALFFLFSFAANILNLVWHGFQYPNWLNYRYSFMLTFILLVMAYRAFSELRSIAPGVLFGGAVVWVAYLFFLQKNGNFLYMQEHASDKLSDLIKNNENFSTKTYFDIRTLLFPLIAIVVFLFVLAAISEAKGKGVRILSFVFLGCVSVELILNGLCCMEGLSYDVGYSSHSRYSNFFTRMNPIVDRVKDADQSFFRMDITMDVERSNVSKDDNQALGIRGLTESTSTLNASTIRFLRNMGYAAASNWTKYVSGTPAGDALLGVKYMVARDRLNNEYDDYSLTYSHLYGTPFASDKIDDNTWYYTYKNPYALSLAFAADRAIRDVDLTTYYNPMDRYNAIYTALTGSDEKIEVFVPVKVTKSEADGFEKSYIVKDTGDMYYKGTKASSTLTFTYTAPKSGSYYFYLSESDKYLTSSYKTDIRVIRDSGAYNLTFNDTYTGKIITVGTFEAGETFRIEVKPNKSAFFLRKECDYLYYADMDALDNAVTALRTGEFQINEGFTDTHLTGTLTADNDKTVFTSIPYDESWVVKVDGKVVETYRTLDALIGFDVTAGEHTVEFLYQPRYLTIGICISVYFILIFLISVMFRKQLVRIPVIGQLFAVKNGDGTCLIDVPSADTQEKSADDGRKETKNEKRK